jgi:hypothetical protein
MDWLKAGLAAGSIRCNESRALVHGVPEGMLLTSPRVFSVFTKDDTRGGGDATDPAERIRSIQRSVLRQGWHLVIEQGINILTYEVVRQGRAVGRVSGIVIERPERFVASAPSVNPLLVRARSTGRLNTR